MTNTSTQTNRPTHRAYAVTKRGEKSRWQEIGAAWSHRDGKGFNLTLDYLPLNGAELVLRVPDAAESASAAEVNGSASEGGY